MATYTVRLNMLDSDPSTWGTWLDDVEVTTSSHIITLSTCIGGMPENRRLLIAVEQEEPPVQGTDMVIVLPADSANSGLPYGIN